MLPHFLNSKENILYLLRISENYWHSIWLIHWHKILIKDLNYFPPTIISVPFIPCCCCYVTSVVSDSVQPHRWQPNRLPRPWDSPGKNTGVGCHFLLQCMKVKNESEVAQLCLTLSDPWTAAHQAPPPMGFSRQEYWSGVPLPSPTKSLVVSNSLWPYGP